MTIASRVVDAADGLLEPQDHAVGAVDGDPDREVGPVRGQLDRPRVVALEDDRLAARRPSSVPVTRQAPVASTFWQYPAGWRNRSGSVSVWSGGQGT